MSETLLYLLNRLRDPRAAHLLLLLMKKLRTISLRLEKNLFFEFNALNNVGHNVAIDQSPNFIEDCPGSGSGSSFSGEGGQPIHSDENFYH